MRFFKVVPNKWIIFIFIFFLGFNFTIGQIQPNYNSFYLNSEGDQLWQLKNIVLEDNCTKVQIYITILNNRSGGFAFPSNIYIDAGYVIPPAFLYIGDEEWEFDKNYYYSKRNKGNGVLCTLVFQRIPAGVSKINYVEPNYIQWNNIPVPNNPNTEHTTWREYSLKQEWDKRGANLVEGIYYFTSTDNKESWGESKPTLAVVKTNMGYDIIYLKGSNANIWKEGDLKARFTPTATPNIYKIDKWLMVNKMSNNDMFVSFTDGYMSVFDNTVNFEAKFIKLYPTLDISDVVSNNNAQSNVAKIAAQEVKSTGSGVIISQNGIIATNYHVIEGATDINVSVKENNKIVTYSAKVLSSDQTNDLALLSIKDPKFNEFNAIPYEMALNTNEVGTQIYSMSFPMTNHLGEEVKVTDGIINSKSGYQGDATTYQISAPIQPGSSGGPLFNKQGQLIGITSSGVMEANSVGYAIKSMFLYNLIESAPITINIPSNNTIRNLSFVDQIKILNNVVVFVEVK